MRHHGEKSPASGPATGGDWHTLQRLLPHLAAHGPDRAAARSYYYSVGFTPEDLKKPLVMVAHEWIGTMPCNWSQRALAQQVMAGALTLFRMELNARHLAGANERKQAQIAHPCGICRDQSFRVRLPLEETGLSEGNQLQHRCRQAR
mgnify:CR=1 FL=1